MKPKRKPGRPAAAEKPDMRTKLLVAGIDEFGNRGFEGASLSRIANEAGGQTNLIRYYFGSKDELWRSCIDHLVDIFNTQLSELLSVPYLSETARLKTIIKWFVHISSDWPQLSRLIIFDGYEETKRTDYIAGNVLGRFYAILEELSEAAQREGTLPPISLRTLFFTITHAGSLPMALQVLTNRLPGGDISKQAVVEDHADSLIKLLFRDEK